MASYYNNIQHHHHHHHLFDKARRSIKVVTAASATAIVVLLISCLTSPSPSPSLDYMSFLHSSSHKYNNNNNSNNNNNNNSCSELIIPIVGAVGPESFAFDINGHGPYTGVSDGRIIKWQANQTRWLDFAVTSPERDGCEEGMDDEDASSSKEHICGRPLGVGFNEETGDLYIADSYMGLLVVGPNGGLATQLATQAHGVPFRFTNSLDVDPRTGVVYFTDSSTKYQRRNHISVIVSGDNTGRLMKYDPKTQQVTLLLNNLMFPNGVSLSKNGHFLLVAETTTCRILKFWLQTSKAGSVEVVAQLPGFPDNIKRNQKGEFWVAINSRRGTFLRWALSKPWIGNALMKLPFDITKAHSRVAHLTGYGLAIKLSEDGKILEEKTGNRWKHVSEVEEQNGNLWIGSVKSPFAIKEKIIS